MFWLLSAQPSSYQWHHSLRRRIRCPTIYSNDLQTCPLILRLLFLALVVGYHLKPILFSISLPIMHFCCLTSWILIGNGCRSSHVQELLELRSDCSSDSASSSDVGSNLSTPADLQSGHPTSISREHRIALSLMVETSHALKPLSELFPSWHFLIRGFLLLAKTLFGLAAAA